jgi:polyisoprenoid-binding protein YceI
MLELKATVFVYTFKEGLLAKLAHDLRLSAHDVEITLKGEALEARVAATSLVVDGVAHGETIDTQALSDHDKRKIQDTMADEILQARAHPHVQWQGQVRRTTGERYEVDGTLTVRGVRQALRAPVAVQPDGLSVELELQPSRFGIPPYKALAGAIRLKDRVVVRLHLHTNTPPAALLANADGVHWTC